MAAAGMSQAELSAAPAGSSRSDGAKADIPVTVRD